MRAEAEGMTIGTAETLAIRKMRLSSVLVKLTAPD